MRIGDGLTIKQGKLRITGIDGLVNVRWHRPLPKEAKLGHAVLSRNGGKWHINFMVDLPNEQVERDDFTPVGIDAGITSIVALSTGETIPNPKWAKAADAKLRRLNRSLARKKRGSRGWKTAKSIIRKHHACLTSKRHDFLHKLSKQLVHKHSHIAIEDLNIKSLARGMLAKEVISAGWATFFNMLRYKAESAGSVVEAVDPKGTSQTCPACGGTVNKTLTERWHSCQHCGFELDRDVAAAQVVLLRASFMRPGTGRDAQSTLATARLASEAVCIS